METAVVTGATGAIGVALINFLIEKGVKVYAIVRPSSLRLNSLPENENLSVLPCELKDYENFFPKIQADMFFHLAWGKTSAADRDNVSSQLQNIEYSISAIKLANRLNCKVFVGAGSQAEYGITEKDLTPYTVCHPESAYGIAKYSAMLFTKFYAEKFNIRHEWARILSVFGKSDGKTSLISYVTDCFEKGISPDLSPCEQDWDYIYSKDCAKALYLIAKNGVHGKAYPVGFGKGRKLKEFVTAIRDLINPNVKINFGARDYYPHQPMHLVADISELKKDTGFIPEYSFEEGLNDMNTEKR